MVDGPLQTFSMCFTCFEEKGIPRFSTFSMQNIPPNGVAFNTCDKGHLSAFVTQAHQFELLSEIAVKAIEDGYYRESVASFAAALERLYEFYVEITSSSNDVDLSEFKAAWKHVSRQSERQLGAFVACYLIENRTAPPMLTQKAVEFRNKVIHQGLIPDKAQAIDFGQAVADCALPVVRLLKTERYKAMLLGAVGKLVRERRKIALAKGANVSVGAGTSPFSLTSAELEISIEALLAKRAGRPDFCGCNRNHQRSR